MSDEMQQDAVDCAVQVRERGEGGLPLSPNARRFGNGDRVECPPVRGRHASHVTLLTHLPGRGGLRVATGRVGSGTQAVRGPALRAESAGNVGDGRARRPPACPTTHAFPHPLTPSLSIHPTPQAIDKYTIEKDIATFVKKEFDKKHTPTWHCVVGRNFGAYGEKGKTNGCARVRACGCAPHSPTIHRAPSPKLRPLAHTRTRTGSYVTHETKHFIYFYIGEGSWRGRAANSGPRRPPALSHSLTLSFSIQQASTPSCCSSPGDCVRGGPLGGEECVNARDRCVCRVR